jgi:hypothetical protein
MWNKRPIIFFLVEYFGTQALRSVVFLLRSQSPSIFSLMKIEFNIPLYYVIIHGLFAKLWSEAIVIYFGSYMTIFDWAR